jgi:hypothetical protein
VECEITKRTQRENRQVVLHGWELPNEAGPGKAGQDRQYLLPAVIVWRGLQPEARMKAFAVAHQAG